MVTIVCLSFFALEAENWSILIESLLFDSTCPHLLKFETWWLEIRYDPMLCRLSYHPSASRLCILLVIWVEGIWTGHRLGYWEHNPSEWLPETYGIAFDSGAWAELARVSSKTPFWTGLFSRLLFCPRCGLDRLTHPGLDLGAQTASAMRVEMEWSERQKSGFVFKIMLF